MLAGDLNSMHAQPERKMATEVLSYANVVALFWRTLCQQGIEAKQTRTELKVYLARSFRSYVIPGVVGVSGGRQPPSEGSIPIASGGSERQHHSIRRGV